MWPVGIKSNLQWVRARITFQNFQSSLIPWTRTFQLHCFSSCSNMQIFSLHQIYPSNLGGRGGGDSVHTHFQSPDGFSGVTATREREWSARAVSPASVVGGLFGFLQATQKRTCFGHTQVLRRYTGKRIWQCHHAEHLQLHYKSPSCTNRVIALAQSKSLAIEAAIKSILEIDLLLKPPRSLPFCR